MRIAMIGSGYVGLLSGACLADFRQGVPCVDKDTDKIAAARGAHADRADLRNVYPPAEVERHGFRYASVDSP